MDLPRDSGGARGGPHSLRIIGLDSPCLPDWNSRIPKPHGLDPVRHHFVRPVLAAADALCGIFIGVLRVVAGPVPVFQGVANAAAESLDWTGSLSVNHGNRLIH